MEAKLKTCPFCGGEARMEVTKKFGGFTALGLFVNHDESCPIKNIDVFNCGYIQFDHKRHPWALDGIAQNFAQKWNRRA